jgi:hypothetical protein
MPAVASKKKPAAKKKAVAKKAPAKSANKAERKFLVTYMRDKKNRPRGVLAAMATTNGCAVAYSLCCRRDIFKKEQGRALALGRLFTHSDTKAPMLLPHSMSKHYHEFVARCEKYFKATLDFESTATLAFPFTHEV